MKTFYTHIQLEKPKSECPFKLPPRRKYKLTAPKARLNTMERPHTAGNRTKATEKPRAGTTSEPNETKVTGTLQFKTIIHIFGDTQTTIISYQST